MIYIIHGRRPLSIFSVGGRIRFDSSDQIPHLDAQSLISADQSDSQPKSKRAYKPTSLTRCEAFPSLCLIWFDQHRRFRSLVRFEFWRHSSGMPMHRSAVGVGGRLGPDRLELRRILRRRVLELAFLSCKRGVFETLQAH